MCEAPESESKGNAMRRRGKRDKSALARLLEDNATTARHPATTTTTALRGRRKKSQALKKHGSDAPSGGIQTLLPSLIGIAILVCGAMAKMGFRGRASVAGIDLGTTNSVVCVQAPAKGVGKIDCIIDPATNSPIIPSVVSFLDVSERKVGPSSKIASLLDPHPSSVVVGQAAKRRIDSHPHHTLYHAKRVLGRTASDPAIGDLRSEVAFAIYETNNDDHDGSDSVAFGVPDSPHLISPQQVGSYVIHHLVQITKAFLGHDNIQSAVICVPAKFNARQRQATARAFVQAGIAVARIVEEPTAAALAYGLHRKHGVDYILVYDFGGGTLDVSILHVSEGFVEVMGSDGDDRLGGADFDTAVANVLKQKHGNVLRQTHETMSRLEESMPHLDLEDRLASTCPQLNEIPLCTFSSFHTIAEQLKISLSSFPNHDGMAESACLGLLGDVVVPAEEIMSVEAFCEALSPVALGITSAEYDRTVQHLYDRSVSPVGRLLHDLDLRQDEIDEVVLVGGTTRMPQIRHLVKQVLPSAQLNTHIDPDLTVAYGAASVID